eukprot:353916-Chlamydomonas_euryale.AAC.2
MPREWAGCGRRTREGGGGASARGLQPNARLAAFAPRDMNAEACTFSDYNTIRDIRSLTTACCSSLAAPVRSQQPSQQRALGQLSVCTTSIAATQQSTRWASAGPSRRVAPPTRQDAVFYDVGSKDLGGARLTHLPVSRSDLPPASRHPIEAKQRGRSDCGEDVERVPLARRWVCRVLPPRVSSRLADARRVGGAGRRAPAVCNSVTTCLSTPSVCMYKRHPQRQSARQMPAAAPHTNRCRRHPLRGVGADAHSQARPLLSPAA